MSSEVPNWSLLFVFAGLLLVADATISVYPGIPQLVNSEARVSVPWLSYIELFKEEVDTVLNRTATGGNGIEGKVRLATNAPHLFEMHPGLGIFVIGESMRADALIVPARGRWSRALSDRLKLGLGARLPDACSTGNSTFVAVPRLMTVSDAKDSHGAANKPTVLALAHAAGAKTAYINNHDVWVVPELGHDLILKTSSMEISSDDEVAIGAMADFLERTPNRTKAVMLHLFGEHFNYEDRYPTHMFSDEPPNLNKDDLLELRYARAAENSIRHLLMAAELLDKQQDPAFLVFTSDHGENLPSDHTGKRYHAGAWLGRNDTTVPVLVLWNKAFAQSGRAKLLENLYNSPGLLAHKDVARAWLALAGMPGDLNPTSNPMTFGLSGSGSQRAPDVACSSLQP